jgi:hypothetical protein
VIFAPVATCRAAYEGALEQALNSELASVAAD